MDTTICKRCLALDPAMPTALRRRHKDHAALLAQARFLACPSESLRQTMARHFPTLGFEQIAHGYRPPFHAPQTAQAPMRPLVVAVIGALGEEKGGLRVEQLAAISRERRLPLRWVVVGDTLRHGGPQDLLDGYLHVHGSYRLGELPDILARHATSVAAFPGRVPETWCLTLDEAWACGLPALVPDLGALGERVRASGAGWVIADWEADEPWLDHLFFLLTPQGRAAWEHASAQAAAQSSCIPPRPPVLERYGRLLAGC